MDNPVRIVLVEDDETIRNGYAYLLNNQDGFTVVKTYSSAESAIKNISDDDADIYLLDISLTGISGIDAIDEIKENAPTAHIIMLTVYEDADMIFKALSKRRIRLSYQELTNKENGRCDQGSTGGWRTDEPQCRKIGDRFFPEK